MKIGNGLGRAGDDMEFPPLDSLGEDYGPDFFGLGQWLDPEMLRASGVGVLAGAGGILAVTNVLERIDYLADKPRWKAGVALATGLVGGRVLWQWSRDAAMAFTGAVAGLGLAKLVGDMAEVSSQLSSAGVTNVPSYQFFSPTRGAVRGLPRGRGVGQVVVTEDDPFALGSVEVTDDQIGVGSWLGG